MIRKKIRQILPYGNFHQKTKKDKWNGTVLGELDFQAGI
jgi:hypothetical protein